jgi:hypothetical protein
MTSYAHMTMLTIAAYRVTVAFVITTVRTVESKWKSVTTRKTLICLQL